MEARIIKEVATVAEELQPPDQLEFIQESPCPERVRIALPAGEEESREEGNEGTLPPEPASTPTPAGPTPAEIKDRISIVDFIRSRGVELKRSGSRFNCLCPFPDHDDRETKSFVVFPDTQSWYCFGCNRGGDVLNFLQEYEGLSFPEALREVAVYAGLRVEAWSPVEVEAYRRQRARFDVLAATAEFYQRQLTPEVSDYLRRERGLTDETVEAEGIGYSRRPSEHGYQGTELLAFLQEKGFSREEAHEAGVLCADGREFFAGHITFPNRYGCKTVYLTGRGYPEKSHLKLPSAAVPCEHLYHEDALAEEEVVLVEGETDACTLRQAGIKACATYGTNGFKEEWLPRFSRVDRVVLAFDRAEAAEAAAEELAVKFGYKARIASVPEVREPGSEPAKDWNELLVRGFRGDAEAFREATARSIAEAPTPTEYRIRRLPTDLPRPEIMERVKFLLAEISQHTAVDQDYYARVLQEHLKETVKLSLTSLKEDIKAAGKALAAEGEATDPGSAEIEILDGSYHRLNPAQDFVNGVAYTTIPLDVLVKCEIQGVEMVNYEQRPYLVTSEHELMPLDEQWLARERKLLCTARPELLGFNRWPKELLDRFLEGEGVDPVLVYHELKALYRYYSDFKDPATPAVLAVATMGTYLYRVFESFPYVAMVAEKGSGKTKVLTIEKKVCFNAVLSVDSSISALFRTIDGSAGTMLLDEAEGLNNTELAQEFRSILNAGYKRGGTVRRTDMDADTPAKRVKEFDVYCPKMLAGIKGLEGVLESRCVMFPMLKTTDRVKANRDVTESGEDWAYLRHLLYSFGLTCAAPIRDIYLTDPAILGLKSVYGREGELWRPFLSIARFLTEAGCEGLFEEMCELAVRKSQEAKEVGVDDWTAKVLLAIERVAQDKSTEEYTTTKDIATALEEFFDETELKRPSARYVGTIIKRFDLAKDKKRRSAGHMYLIHHAGVVDVLRRYGVDG